MLNAAAIITALNEAGYTAQGKITGDFPNAVQRFFTSDRPELASVVAFPQISVTFNLETGTVGHLRGFIKNGTTNLREWRSFRKPNDEAFNADSITALLALIEENMEAVEAMLMEQAAEELRAMRMAEAARVELDPAMIDESEEQDFVGREVETPFGEALDGGSDEVNPY